MQRSRLASLVLCAAFLPGLAQAAERGFDSLVRGVETEFGVRKTHIPMFGLAKLFIRAGSAGNVRQLNLATFEDLRWSPDSATRFRALVQRSLGDDWSPMVQVQAPGRKEYTAIYCSSAGGRWRMIVATMEAREATLVEMRLDAREMLSWFRDPESARGRSGVGHGARREDDDGPGEQ